jgi:hypothetical protein
VSGSEAFVGGIPEKKKQGRTSKVESEVASDQIALLGVIPANSLETD